MLKHVVTWLDKNISKLSYHVKGGGGGGGEGGVEETKYMIRNQVQIFQGSYGILNTFFKHFSGTFAGQFMSFSRTFTIAKK